MTLQVYKPTEDELAFVAAIWGLPSDRLSWRLDEVCRSHREFGRPHFTSMCFDDDLWHTTMQVLDYLVGSLLFYQEPDNYLANWDDVAAAARFRFHKVHEEAKTDLMDRYKAAPDPTKFAQEHVLFVTRKAQGIAGTLFDGVEVVGVKDPWKTGPAEWFLDNMTQFKVFAFWYAAYASAMDAVEANLSAWMDPHNYGTSDEPAEFANNAFDDCLKRLDGFITKMAQAKAA